MTTAHTTPADTLEERVSAVRSGVADAARDAGRDLASITTIVVTKFHPASLTRELFALGVRDVGENRHQDAAPKARETSDLDLTWHFVGQLQSKKARSVLEYAQMIHSLDRVSLVQSIDSAQTPAQVFIQLNLTDDPARGGVAPDGVLALAERVLESPYLQLRGVMAVAPLGVNAREAFASVRAVSERLLAAAPHATDISMGMSTDYREAILEGATHLRIGTAITGNRPIPG